MDTPTQTNHTMNPQTPATPGKKGKRRWITYSLLTVACLAAIWFAHVYLELTESRELISQLEQGVKYYKGEGVKQDVAKGKKLVSEALKKGVKERTVQQKDADAMYALAECYGDGIGVECDLKKTAHWYRLAAENGNADAMDKLADCYNYAVGVEVDEVKAGYWYRKAAEKGNASAMMSLAACYRTGRGGVKKDEAQAIQWLRKSAETGDVDAMFALGACYEAGTDGVEKDLAQAARWYRKPAEKGNIVAIYRLALCYRDGIGVGKDPAQAVKWFRKGAKYKYSNHANVIYGGKNLTHAYAMFELGKCYRDGIGVEKDEERAAKWICKAAAKGRCTQARELLQKLAPEKAVQWYRAAAKAKIAYAMYELGKCYRDGTGIEKDLEKAAQWFQKAAEDEDDDAAYELGKCYLEGIGVERDEAQAKQWLRKAAGWARWDDARAKELLQKLEQK